jgi:hypothetical protein
MRTIKDINRRSPNLRKSKVTEVLPGYFSEEYPNLIAFLEAYYESLDQEGEITEELEYGLFALRDIEEVDLERLDRIFFEIGGQASSKYFTNPRLIAKLIASYFRLKGTKYSAVSFFRTFLNITPEIRYPKEDMFIVGESRIGYESLKRIQDAERYQVFSILVQSSAPISEWIDLYKVFVHPAGFYLSGDVILETTASTDQLDPPLALPDDGAGTITIGATVASADNIALSSVTSIVEVGGTKYRLSLEETLDKYASTTLEQIDNLYDNIYDVAKIESPTFDDSDGIEASNEFESMDLDRFDTDSSL